MNLVFIVTDTLRADYIGAYGGDWVETPNLDAFARSAVRFNDCHGEGLPTIQARRVYMTGRGVLPFEDTPQLKGVDPNLPGWRPLREDDVALAEYLRERGYWTGMVTDLWHFFKPNMNFHRGFHTWEFIRGQERDPWRVGPPDKYRAEDFIPEHLIDEKGWRERILPYVYNTEWFEGEEDYFVARTMRAAAEWLENCRDRAPFFLYVDTFDPHEVFDPPRHYAQMYHDEYPLRRPLYGYGVNMDAVTDEDVVWIRALYAAKVSLVDRWFGYLMEHLERLGLMDDTVIAFTSDHGTEFFEHGKICKGADAIYAPMTRLPLIARSPRHEALAGRAVDGLVSAIDFAPTLLRLIGQPPPETMTGLDCWPLATGEASEIRDHLITGFSRSGAVRTLDWLLHTHAEPNARNVGNEAQTPPRLFDLKNDPGEKENVIERHPEVRRELLEKARRVWPDAQ